MNTAISNNNDHISIVGPLSFYSVADLFLPGKKMILQSEKSLTIDLQAVQHIDSAGLALLIAWYRYASKLNKSVCFANISQQMRSMMQVMAIDTILPIKEVSNG